MSKDKKMKIWLRMTQSMRRAAEERPKKAAVLLVIAALLVMVLMAVLAVFLDERMGDNAALLIASLVIGPVFFVIHHERARRITVRNMLLMALAGTVIGAVVVMWAGRPPRMEACGDFFMFNCHAMWINTIIIIPFLEEKVVRGLLLDACRTLFGNFPAIMATALMFAAAHWRIFAWTLVFSALLAWLAIYRKMGVIERAMAHGSYNLILTVAALPFTDLWKY